MSQQLGSEVEKQSKANINKSTNPGQLFLFKEKKSCQYVCQCMSSHCSQAVHPSLLTKVSTRPEESRVCVMDTSADTSTDDQQKKETRSGGKPKAKLSSGPPFSLKKWNAVAMWQWDVECDTCAICRVQVMGKDLISELRVVHAGL